MSQISGNLVEIVGNLHLHTTASDGTGTHAEVAAAAARAGLDFIVYTDHNTWVDGNEGWYRDSGSGREVLRLMGQEINDEQRQPECDHLLAHFVCQNLQPVAARPQQLIEAVLAANGLCFLAHPLERPGYGGPQAIYPWVDWEISGFTGLELWNTMTEVKWQLRNLARGITGAYLPYWVLRGPFPETLAKWDELLAGGQKVVAIGNADAHGNVYAKGPFRRRIYPYEFLFRAVNTHLLLAQPLARELDQARQQIRQALQQGHCFVSYDLIASSRGFTFTAASGPNQASMGDTLTLSEKATLSVVSPQSAWLRLVQDGQIIAQTKGKSLTWQTDTPGVYRLEAYRRYWGRQRGWVFTNPIYIIPA
ncbi:MAG: CehA/McbA family metallohydrolase [Anaerolineae bacterium]|nr:CehA/McbA family metallohydrolase [Anaerolineae bacterium]